MIQDNRQRTQDLPAIATMDIEPEHPRGRLKIFLGYAPGVGKTFAMLYAARQRQQAGCDVVIGAVDAHRNPETEALARGLERAPGRVRSQTEPPELDIDALLKRRPDLALIDDLSQANPPGARHTRRYLDAAELISSGIDVYATLNVQNLESLTDVITQITGVQITDTIPDRVFDQAEIELVDLPPDELLARIEAGKVRIPGQDSKMHDLFFRKGNLTALRELAFRRAAERIDHQMLDYMHTKAIPGPWAASERLLVCVSPNPLAERLVRSARRLADEIGAEWLALHVVTPENRRIFQAQGDRLTKTMLLAEELGGRALTLSGRSVPETIMKYAREHNFTKIIVGQPLHSRWKELFFSSVVGQLVHAGGPIDVHVISGEAVPAEAAPSQRLPAAWSWKRYLVAALLVLAAASLSALLRPFIAPVNLVMVYLSAVLLAAYYLGRGPSILVSALSVLVFDFFFVPPYLTFAVADTEYILTFIGLFVVGLVISELTARVREQVEISQSREAETATLYALSRELSIAEGVDEIAQSVIDNVGHILSREAAIFLPEQEGSQVLAAKTTSIQFVLDEQDLAAAQWSFQHGQMCGHGTATLAESRARFLPLKTAKGEVGVLGVKPKIPGDYLTTEQRRLLETFASQAALALERARLAEQAQLSQLLQAAERLQTALLNSISHDLRTPLVSVTGALSSLAQGGPAMDAEIRQSLVETALEEADRMNRLIGNLLNMTRLEAGALHIVRQPCDIQDVIGTALDNLGERLGARQITINVPDNIPMIPMDFVLMVQVLVNLIDNSVKYSPLHTPLEIQARQEGAALHIQICDRGVGIPTDQLVQIFEKFYRVQNPENVSGIGLGLSISKGIVEAHGGRIWAENHPRGGAVLHFTLPLSADMENNR